MRRQVVSEEGLKNGNGILGAIGLGIGFFVAITIWQVPIVDLVVVGVLLSRTTSGLARIQQQFQKALMVESAYLEVQALITETAAAPEQNPGRQARFERECRLQNVSFAHARTPVLHAVPGRARRAGHGFTGPSGAGKTTIADLILGLHQPDAGQVLLDGVPCARSTWRAGGAWSATCRRSWCCSTTASSPTWRSGIRGSARPRCSTPWKSPGPGTSCASCPRA